MSNVEAFRKALKESLNRNQEAFLNETENKKALDELLQLSKDDLDAVLPHGTGTEIYANLISVLKEATRHNIAQAELVNQIKRLGQAGVSIAKLVAPLAAIL